MRNLKLYAILYPRGDLFPVTYSEYLEEDLYIIEDESNELDNSEYEEIEKSLI